MKSHETDRKFSKIRKKVQDATKETYGLADSVARIRRFLRRCINPKQMDATILTILVDNENKEWCLQNGIKKVTTENGRTKAYGKMNTRNYNRSHYRIPGKRCTTRKVLKG